MVRAAPKPRVGGGSRRSIVKGERPRSCEGCGSDRLYVDVSKDQRRCRVCEIKHLKVLLSLYGAAGMDEQRSAILAQLRKAEEEIS